MTTIRNKHFVTYNKQEQKQITQAVAAGRTVLCRNNNGTNKTSGLQFTIDHTGKMAGVISLSSSIINNPICNARRQDKESICAFCFSAAMMKQYTNLENMLQRNTVVLQDHVISREEIPVILSETKQLRVESFGDVSSVIQAANYLRICAANPWQKCAIWTKNPAFYHAAIASGLAYKAKNTQLIYSSHKVNEVSAIPEKYRYLFDKVFTVFNPEGIKEQNVSINCGARPCKKCQRCYKPNKAGVTLQEVSEKLK